MSLLSQMVSSNMLKDRTRSQAQSNNHYSACSDFEILLWIAQRCEFTLDVKEKIKKAYKNVFSSFFYSIILKIHISLLFSSISTFPRSLFSFVSLLPSLDPLEGDSRSFGVDPSISLHYD